MPKSPEQFRPSEKETSQQKEQSLSEVEVEFVLGTHGEGDEKIIADALSKHDVIAIEDVGWESDSPEELTRTCYDLVTQANPEAVHQDRAIQEHIREMRADDPIMAELLERTAGTGKRIWKIDAPEGELKELNQESNAMLHESYKAFFRGDIVEALLARDALGVIEAQRNMRREHIVTEQISALIKRSAKNNKPLSIGVFEGAVHTGPSHQFLQSETETKRTFFGKSPRRYVPTNALSRYYRFRINENAPKELVEKALFEQVVMDLGGEDIYGALKERGVPTHQAYELFARWLHSVPIGKIRIFFKTWEQRSKHLQEQRATATPPTGGELVDDLARLAKEEFLDDFVEILIKELPDI